MPNKNQSTVQQPNGAPHSEQTPHPLNDVFSTEPQDGGGPLLQMQTGLFALGRNRSLQSGTVTALPEDIRYLEDHARSIARDTYREQYDPSQNAHDRMHQAEYERLVNQREETEKGLAHAEANVRDAERELAAIPKAGQKPAVVGWLAVAFIVAITVTLAPTLHDFIYFTIPDALLSWFSSSLSAAFIAAMLTWAILSGRRSKLGWLGVAAGILVGIGFAALRLSYAHGAAETGFGIGLSIIEIGAVILLEWLASGLRTRESDWQVLKTAEDKAVALRDTEMADVERRKKHLQEVNGAISQKIAYVEDRNYRNIHLPELEAVAIKAVLDGYNAGIAENVGRLNSVWRSQ